MSYLSDKDKELISQCVHENMNEAFEKLWSDLMDCDAVDDDEENKRMAFMLFQNGAWNATAHISFSLMQNGLRGAHAATNQLLMETHPGLSGAQAN